MVLAASALFAVNGTVSKLILRTGVSAPDLTTLRALGACAGLIALGAALRPGCADSRSPHGSYRCSSHTASPVFLAVPMLYFVAIARMPVGVALLFEYTAPLFVALWARFGQRRPVRPRLWAGLALCLLGLACVAEVWGDLSLDGVGVLAGLGAAVLLAAYFILGAKGVSSRDTVSLTGWAFGVSAVAGLLFRAACPAPLRLERAGRAHRRRHPALAALRLPVDPRHHRAVPADRRLAAAPARDQRRHPRHDRTGARRRRRLAHPGGEWLDPAQLAGGALLLIGVTLAETARVPVRRRRSSRCRWGRE